MNAMQFLISTLFDLFLMVVLLRFWLQWAKADFYNPMSQFVVKATSFAVNPLRKIIPGLGGSREVYRNARCDWQNARSVRCLNECVGLINAKRTHRY